MERFALKHFEDALPGPVLRSQEILEHKVQGFESQSLIRTVAETDGLTPLLQIIIQPALPFL